ERERRGLAPRLVQRGAPAAHAERLAREIGHARKGFAPVVGAAERKAGLDALVEGGGARRVVPAEADAGDAEARGVEVTPGLDVVDHGLDGDLVVAPDREVVFGFALPGPVEGERRYAARQEWLLVGVGLLLARIEPAGEQQDRRTLDTSGLTQNAGEPLALVRHLDALARRPQIGRRELAAFDRLHVRRLHLREGLH